ncbi:MAG: major capsid protein [Mycobacterium sp.]
MSGFLTPELDGLNVTVSTVMQQPLRIRDRISALAADQMVLDKIFHTHGRTITGGAMLYNVVKISDFFRADDVKQRGPGDEYEVVRGVDPTTEMAKPEDWGGKFPVEDERITRNDTEYMQDQTTQLTNTIVEKLNKRAFEVLDAKAGTGPNTIVGNDWMNAVTVGPEANLSEGSELPAADLAAASMAGELERLGTKYDTLLVNPQEKFSLQVAYGDKLQAMLDSAGLKMFSYFHITPGTAWVLQRGQVGIIGFEKALTVETWREPRNRTSWVQAYAVPFIAVNKPHCAKKLTGLAG